MQAGPMNPKNGASMTDRVIRARLLVRLAGLGLLALFIPDVGQLAGDLMAISSREAVEGLQIRMYFWRISIGNARNLLFEYSIPLAAVAWGMVLLCRGSRRMERKVAHALGVV